MSYKYSEHQLVENGRLTVFVKMYDTITCEFTMESYEIIEKSKEIIVPEVIKLIENPLFKGGNCDTARKQLSYCKEKFLRDCSCHGCGGYLCSKQRKFMKNKIGVPVC